MISSLSRSPLRELEYLRYWPETCPLASRLRRERCHVHSRSWRLVLSMLTKMSVTVASIVDTLSSRGQLPDSTISQSLQSPHERHSVNNSWDLNVEWLSKSRLSSVCFIFPYYKAIIWSWQFCVYEFWKAMLIAFTFGTMQPFWIPFKVEICNPYMLSCCV